MNKIEEALEHLQKDNIPDFFETLRDSVPENSLTTYNQLRNEFISNTFQQNFVPRLILFAKGLPDYENIVKKNHFTIESNHYQLPPTKKNNYLTIFLLSLLLISISISLYLALREPKNSPQHGSNEKEPVKEDTNNVSQERNKVEKKTPSSGQNGSFIAPIEPKKIIIKIPTEKIRKYQKLLSDLSNLENAYKDTDRFHEIQRIKSVLKHTLLIDTTTTFSSNDNLNNYIQNAYNDINKWTSNLPNDIKQKIDSVLYTR